MKNTLTVREPYSKIQLLAEVAEQADAHDSKSCSLGSVGSIPTFGTTDYSTSPPLTQEGVPLPVGGPKCPL